MVHLLLSTTRGNSGTRSFPYQGYLGLTPVRVEGIVRTKLDEDGKPLPAKSLSVSVRCYQSRLTRTRSFRSTLVVDYTDVLWVKPPDRDHADVGELEFPFKITLPKRTPGFSTANYQDYRVFWRLEAILDHVHIPSIGSRIVRYFDLALVRYDLPPSLQPTPASSPHQRPLCHQTSKPRAPVIRYNMSTPTLPVGPSDIIYATLSLQPLDPTVTVRSATVSVERRIELHNTPASPTPLVTAGINYSAAAAASPTVPFSPVSPTSSAHFEEDASTPTTSRFPFGSHSNSHSPYTQEFSPTQTSFDPSASNYSVSSTAPLLSPSNSCGSSAPVPISSRPPPSPSSSPSAPTPAMTSPPIDTPLKTLSATLVSTEVSSFCRDNSGVFVAPATLQWPESRGHFRWAIGETMHSNFATVRFFVRTKITVTGPGGSDTLELEPREVTIVPTNEGDRRVAMEKWAEQKEIAQRSKSRSPWRRRGEDGPNAESANGKTSAHGLPSPPQTPAQSSDGYDRRKSSAPTGSKSRKKVPRRPHTSAGPRDKSNFAFTVSSTSAEVGMHSEPDHGDPVSTSSRESESRASSSHSHSSASKKFRESGLGESMLNAVDKVRGKSRSRDGDMKRDRSAEDGVREDERERRERLKKTGLGLQLGLELEQVRAWEAELARIEMQSRRSSAGMFGVLGMSRRHTGV